MKSGDTAKLDNWVSVDIEDAPASIFNANAFARSMSHSVQSFPLPGAQTSTLTPVCGCGLGASRGLPSSWPAAARQ